MARYGDETSRHLIARFPTGEDLRAATELARESGCDIVETYGPRPVHGIEEAMGLAPTRLPWICFFCGVTGLSLALWFQHWSSSSDWPLNVGGKPFDSWPAFVPVAFEMTVLFAGLGVVFAFFLRARLFPGRKARAPRLDVTDDAFVLVLRERGQGVDEASWRLRFGSYGLLDLEDRSMESER
jgi:hypothetical protein